MSLQLIFSILLFLGAIVYALFRVFRPIAGVSWQGQPEGEKHNWLSALIERRSHRQAGKKENREKMKQEKAKAAEKEKKNGGNKTEGKTPLKTGKENKTEKPKTSGKPAKKKGPTPLELQLQKIPSGRIITFSRLAERMGQKNAGSQLSLEIRELSRQKKLPWWRVIRKDKGKGILLGGELGEMQKELLKAEGVEVEERYISLPDFEW